MKFILIPQNDPCLAVILMEGDTLEDAIADFTFDMKLHDTSVEKQEDGTIKLFFKKYYLDTFIIEKIK